MADVKDYDEWEEQDVKALQIELMKRLVRIEDSIKRMDQHQRTIMVGWNSFIEHAGMHLNNLFRGKVPAPLLRKLIEASFRDDPKHAKTESQ